MPLSIADIRRWKIRRGYPRVEFRPDSQRVAKVMFETYGHVTGTGMTGDVLAAILNDVRAYCAITHQDFNQVLEQARKDWPGRDTWQITKQV